MPSFGRTAAKRRVAKTVRRILNPKQKAPTRAELIEQARQLIAVLIATAMPIPVATTAPVVVNTAPPADPELDLRVVVGLRCYERDSIGTVLLRRKGTGVLISRSGHILTSRHLVDPDWLALSGAEGLAKTSGQPNNVTFDHCDVALPDSPHTPTDMQIRLINPQLPLGFFLFVSHRVFTPTTTNLSDGEKKLLDFALLKIDGPTPEAQLVPDAPKYSPDHFPFVRLTETLPTEQTEVVTFGYPAEAGLSAGSRFGEFYLKGSIEQVISYGRGDEHFRETPLMAELRAESGIFGGRSGSPIFYRGNVFALIFGTDPELLSKNYAVTTAAILRTLREQGQAAELGY